MNLVLTGAAALLWFALLCPLALRRLAVDAPPGDGPVWPPFLLVTVFSFVPLVFDVEREDGTAVLNDGLSASNLLSVGLVGLAAAYLLARAALDRRSILLPFAPPYLPFTLMLAVDAASALWSVVPSYTLYRAVEVGVFATVTIQLFDRTDLERRLAALLSLSVVAWLIAASPALLDGLAHGIVFSAAKNNMMPLVCAALILLALFDPASPHRLRTGLLGAVGFALAGSAASTAALLAALGPALLIASPRPLRRAAGFAAAAAMAVVFMVLVVGLSQVPGLIEIASAVLQKPASELANATGRDEFWPLFLAATRTHVLGSGFAADRFLQLLIPTGDFAAALGQEAIHLSSAHNLVLSAWAGTGVIGVAFCAVVLGTAIRWGLRLDRARRRVVVALVLMLVLNGMTTPGIFQAWTANTFVFLAILAYARIAAMASGTVPAAAAPSVARRVPVRRRVPFPAA